MNFRLILSLILLLNIVFCSRILYQYEYNIENLTIGDSDMEGMIDAINVEIPGPGTAIIRFVGEIKSEPNDYIGVCIDDQLTGSGCSASCSADGGVRFNSLSSDVNYNSFSVSQVYIYSEAQYEYYSLRVFREIDNGWGYCQTSTGSGSVDIYGNIIVEFIPESSPIQVYYDIGNTGLQIYQGSHTAFKSHTITFPESGKVIAHLNGSVSTSYFGNGDGDRIILMVKEEEASWGDPNNYEYVTVEQHADRLFAPFSHTMSYAVTAGTKTYQAAALISLNENSGSDESYAALTHGFVIKYIPNSAMANNDLLISNAYINTEEVVATNSASVVASLSTYVNGPGFTIVRFDGHVWGASPNDRFELAADDNSNNSNNDNEMIRFEALDNDLNRGSFAHTKVYKIDEYPYPQTRTYYAHIARAEDEDSGTGEITVNGNLSVEFVGACNNVAVGNCAIPNCDNGWECTCDTTPAEALTGCGEYEDGFPFIKYNDAFLIGENETFGSICDNSNVFLGYGSCQSVGTSSEAGDSYPNNPNYWQSLCTETPNTYSVWDYLWVECCEDIDGDDICDDDDDCIGNYDECNICNGSGIPEGQCDCDGNIDDECGVCGGDNSSCADCAGVPNGNNVEDNCGTCDADGSNDCVPDCAGTWGGSLVYDECGVCGGNNDTCGPCIDHIDCSSGYFCSSGGLCVEYSMEYCTEFDCYEGDGDCDNADECEGPLVCGIDNCNFGNGIYAGADCCYCENYDCNGICGGSAVEDCTGQCGGSAVVDECGVCDGDGIDEGACDCDGNVEDCTGQCGGLAVVDGCGVCDGGQSEGFCEECGSDWFGPDCAGLCTQNELSLHSEDDCGYCSNEDQYNYNWPCDCSDYPQIPILGGEVGDELNSLWLENNGDGTWNVGFNSNGHIAGFQFEIDGATVNSASGGVAEDAGFMLSNSATTVLGFSLSGDTIPPADGGVLVVLDITGAPTGISAIVISNPDGSGMDFTYDPGSGGSYVDACDCDGNIDDECGVCGGDGIDEGVCDCDGNVEDCAGECGGLSLLDECGVCNGDNFIDDCLNFDDCSKMDCFGICHPSTSVGEIQMENGLIHGAYIDDCGVCSDGESGHTSNLEMDCAEVCSPETPEGMIHYAQGLEYGAYIDDCDVCSAGITGHMANSDIDECGECFGNNQAMDCTGECFGISEVDECGFCGGMNASMDCDGECDGEAEIDCSNTCAGGTTGMDPQVCGCMDETATNYDSDATWDDETCSYSTTFHVGEGYEFDNIQDAIDQSSPFDSIVVHPGIYKETLSISHNITLTSNDVEKPQLTMLERPDGHEDGPVIAINDVGSQTIIKGFTISNGRNLDGTGGGIRISNSDVTLKKLVLVGNKATSGGAIGLLNSSPYIENVTMVNNHSYGGGAIYIGEGSYPVMNSCIMWENHPSALSCSPEANGLNIKHSNYEEEIYPNNIPCENFNLTEEQNNTHVDPQFMLPLEGDVEEEFSFSEHDADYSLAHVSPCINKGDPSIVDSDGTYLDQGAIHVSNGCTYAGAEAYGEFEVSCSENIHGWAEDCKNNDLVGENCCCVIMHDIFHVSEGENIQGAIDEADHDDVIYVEPGTYMENLVIRKAIHLRGGGIDSTIIMGSGATDSDVYGSCVSFVGAIGPRGRDGRSLGYPSIIGFTLQGGMGTKVWDYSDNDEEVLSCMETCNPVGDYDNSGYLEYCFTHCGATHVERRMGGGMFIKEGYLEAADNLIKENGGHGLSTFNKGSMGGGITACGTGCGVPDNNPNLPPDPDDDERSQSFDFSNNVFVDNEAEIANDVMVMGYDAIVNLNGSSFEYVAFGDEADGSDNEVSTLYCHDDGLAEFDFTDVVGEPAIVSDVSRIDGRNCSEDIEGCLKQVYGSETNPIVISLGQMSRSISRPLQIPDHVTLEGVDTSTTILSASGDHRVITGYRLKKGKFKKMAIKDGSESVGGCISFRQSSAEFDNVLISNCNAFLKGGAIHVSGNDENDGLIEIKNTVIRGDSAIVGGGIYVMNSNNVIIEGSIFEKNDVDDGLIENINISGYGGALHVKNSTITISNSEFIENSGSGNGNLGAAIHGENSQIFMDGSKINENRNTGDGSRGAGIYLVGGSSPSVILNSEIRGNASTRGAAIYLDQNDLKLERMIISGNETADKGSIYARKSALSIVNSTIVGNTYLEDDDVSAGAIYLDYASPAGDEPGGILSVINSIVWGNKSPQINTGWGSNYVNMAYSNLEPGILDELTINDFSGYDNFYLYDATLENGDPEFISALTWEDPLPSIEGDFRLTESSFSCINQGTVSIPEYSGDEMNDFIVNDYIGSAPDIGAIESEFDFENMVELEIELNEGWNWISYNLEVENDSLNALLGSIADSAFITSHLSGTSTYYGENGWFGSLKTLDPREMYKLKMIESSSASIIGSAMTASENPINLILGFNWIGYLPQNPGDVTTAFESIGDLGIFVTSQLSGTSTNYGEYGWFGDLGTLEPGAGYLLKMSALGTLTYPEFGLARVAENKPPVELTQATADWDFNHADHEFIGTITASIESREDFDGDLIGVFVDDKCRGIAERMHFPFNDSYMYIVQVYSNVVEGEELHFKYLDSSSDKVVEFEETLTFTNNMVVGDGFNTFALSREVGQEALPMAWGLSDAYPNPFNPVTSFSYTIPEDGMVSVTVHDLNGRQVAQLVNGREMAGSYPMTWDAGNLSSGLYMMQMMVNGKSFDSKKIIILK